MAGGHGDRICIGTEMRLLCVFIDHATKIMNDAGEASGVQR